MGLTRLKAVGIIASGAIQVGQYSETVEDVDLSIKLVREAVRENKNIGINFCITTPFPGSPLYDRLIAEGKLSGPQEFYDLYFSKPAVDGGNLKLVVNCSAMDDDTLLNKFREINEVYNEEKKHARGFLLQTVEKCRINAWRVNYHLRRLSSKGLPPQVESLIMNRLYNPLYDKSYIALEKMSLKLRGI